MLIGYFLLSFFEYIADTKQLLCTLGVWFALNDVSIPYLWIIIKWCMSIKKKYSEVLPFSPFCANLSILSVKAATKSSASENFAGLVNLNWSSIACQHKTIALLKISLSFSKISTNILETPGVLAKKCFKKSFDSESNFNQRTTWKKMERSRPHCLLGTQADLSLSIGNCERIQ